MQTQSFIHSYKTKNQSFFCVASIERLDRIKYTKVDKTKDKQMAKVYSVNRV